VYLSVLLAIATQLGADAPAAPASQELFRDPGFKNGFNLTAASHPAPKVEIGVLQTDASLAPQAPDWRIAQWATRDLIQPGKCVQSPAGVWIAENSAKRVEIERSGTGVTRLLLEGRAIYEYNGHLRANGEPWPHLLIEQGFPAPLRIDAQKRLRFALDVRVPFCKAAPGKLDPGLHTAQASAYWTVHNVTAGNPDEHDMIWFGIPLFDARYDIPPGNYAIDGGKADASGKFICLMDGKRFWNEPTGDGKWRRLDVDLIGLLRDGLAITQEHGHLKNTTLKDLAITSFNLGWELPGSYDAALEIRGLSMKAEND
jgi:hypothetical protein